MGPNNLTNQIAVFLLTVLEVFGSVDILKFPHQAVSGSHRARSGSLEVVLSRVQSNFLQNCFMLIGDPCVSTNVLMITVILHNTR